MPLSHAGLTNEKLYQVRLLLAMIDPASSRAARHALLDSAAFGMYAALLSFLREIAAAHRLPPVFVPSIENLEQQLSLRGITDSCLLALQDLHQQHQWPWLLMQWHRAALEGDVVDAQASHSGAAAIRVVDADTVAQQNRAIPDLQHATDVLERLRNFIEHQRAHLVEW